MTMTMPPKSKLHSTNFSWSYSRLKNYETCPRRYAAVDLRKEVQEVKSQELERGEKLHAAMYSRVASGSPLPAEFIYMEKWAENLTKIRNPFQIIQCELKLAVDKNGKPVGFFEKSVWLRGKIDYFCLVPAGSHDIGRVVDYKTGRPKEDWTQLMLSAYLIFCHYKNVSKLRTEFLWTEYSDTSHEKFSREEITPAMANLLPRVIAMQDAHANDNFEPKPCGLCAEYCPVSSCEFWGKRRRREG
jgi:hypothetical protein